MVNFSKCELARLKGSWFKKGCVFLYYSSTESESNLHTERSGVGAARQSCIDPVN
jgi:hypothetical protein